GAQLEFSLDARDLHCSTAMDLPAASELVAGEFQLRFRVPNTTDLAAAARCTDVAAARRVLTERCVLEANRAGAGVAPADIPQHVMEKLASAIAETDSRADCVL